MDGVCLDEYIINKVRFVSLQGKNTKVTYTTTRHFQSAVCGFPLVLLIFIKKKSAKNPTC
jgi:hypothetical protein